jgi:pimeloyl-ACP methyl ester carboxylesterase
MTASRKRAAAAIAVLVVLGAVACVARPYVMTASFLLDIAGVTGGWRRLLPSHHEDVVTRDLVLPTRYGPVAARLYVPASKPDRTVIAFPGIHAGGVEEPRLDRFSRRLAGTGLSVLSVPLPELREFLITSRSTDAIEDIVRDATNDRTISPHGQVSIVGVSFSGGLALVAAGRPSLEGRVTQIVSLGGYGDLGRTLHYLCTGLLPDGTRRPPHDYGVAIIALGAVADLVPADQAAALHDGIRAYLDASAEDPPGPKALALLARAREDAAAMPEPARTIMTWVNTHDVAALGHVLDPLVDELTSDPGLSPERSPATHVPVFVLQGRDDNVVPSSETPLLAHYLQAQGNTRVRWLLTPALSHAGLTADVHAADAWRLLSFWNDVGTGLFSTD